MDCSAQPGGNVSQTLTTHDPCESGPVGLSGSGSGPVLELDVARPLTASAALDVEPVHFSQAVIEDLEHRRPPPSGEEEHPQEVWKCDCGSKSGAKNPVCEVLLADFDLH